MTGNSRDKLITLPQRKIKPTRRSVSGIYAFRGETPIQFESTLERDFLILTEYSREVLDVISQPAQIPFLGKNGQTFTYTPDFLVYYRLGNRLYDNYPKPVLVEVKPRGQWQKNWRKWSTKWKAAIRYAREQGWVFHLMDENRIRNQSLDNIRFLERYKRMEFPRDETMWVLENLRQMGSSPFHYLLSRHFMGIYRAQGVSLLWHLLATRQLDCDITRPLNENTELWVPTDE